MKKKNCETKSDLLIRRNDVTMYDHRRGSFGEKKKPQSTIEISTLCAVLPR